MRGAQRCSWPSAELPGLRGVRLRSGPSLSSTTVEILRSNGAVEVLQVQEGWFEVRLANGVSGWVWAPLLALSTVLVQDDEEARGPEQYWEARGSTATLFFITGRSLWVESYESTGDVVKLSTAQGERMFLDKSLVGGVERADREVAWDWGPVFRRSCLRTV